MNWVKITQRFGVGVVAVVVVVDFDPMGNIKIKVNWWNLITDQFVAHHLMMMMKKGL